MSVRATEPSKKAERCGKPGAHGVCRGRPSVHLRHLAVHEHQGIGHPFKRFDRLTPVPDDIHSITELLNHLHGDFLVDRVVFCHEDVLPGPSVNFRQAVTGDNGCGGLSDRGRGVGRIRKDETEAFVEL